MNNNPLYVAQREKAGPETFKKYLYQYNWALYRVFEEHEKDNEYIIFIELHEDVILSNSLNKDNALFEFNQIKTTSGKYTDIKLLKKKKMKKGEGNSVLGKLIDSCSTKPYANKIESINLVSVNGFSLNLKKEGILLESTNISDIDEKIIDKLVFSINEELDISYFPINLNFIIPKLPEINFQENVIGKISLVINKLFPSSTTNSDDIYKLLINELQSKGTITFDYKNWDELLDKKGLSSNNVKEIINKFTQHKKKEEIYKKLHDVLSELDLKILEKKAWEKAFNRYYLEKLGNKTTKQFDIKKSIISVIQDNLDSSGDSIKILLDKCKENLDDNIKVYFNDEKELKSAIICELILEEFI